MKTGAVRNSVLTALVVGGLAASGWGQKVYRPLAHGPGDPANCVVKITCDPALLPLNSQSVKALLLSNFVAAEAYKQALHTDVLEVDYLVEFTPLPGGTTAISAGLMPVTPMMGVMGGPLPQPPQPGGGFVPTPPSGVGGMGDHGGLGSFGIPSDGVGGGGGGGRGGFDVPVPSEYGASGRAGTAGGLSPGLTGAPLGGPMMPGAAPARPVSPGMPGQGGLPSTPDMMIPSPRGSSILGQIEAQIDGAGPRENEAFLRAVCERLQQSLVGLWEKEMSSIGRQLEMSRDELLRAEKKLRELQERRRDLLGAGQVDLTPEAVIDRIRQLDRERQRMEMDLLGQQARLKAVQQQIQATSERSLASPGGDEMIKPLQAKLEVLRNELKRVEKMNQQDMVPGRDVENARVAVLEAEVQLAEARRKAAEVGGVEVLGKLNTELAMLSVNVAETEARLMSLREQIEKARQLVGVVDEYEMRVLMEMPHARRAYESSKLRVEELEQRIRTAVAPTVTVIGGATSKPAK